MRLHIQVGLTVALEIAAACSTNNSDPLAGGDAGDGCLPMGTTVSDGQGYVQTEGCEGCHGANLAGSLSPLASGQDGITIPAGSYLYPPNLTPDPTTGLGNWTTGQIDYAITEGIDNTGLDLCPEMGRHYPNMCPDEVTGIINYLRSIPAVVQKVPGSICPPLKTGTPPSGTGGTDGGA
jgi:hypothetical protein